MRNCRQCGKITNNPTYCSRSCAATYNNKVVIKRKITTERKCKYCNQSLGMGYRGPKVCIECSHNSVDWYTITLKEYRDKYGTAQLHSRLRNLSRAIYKKHKLSEICVKCGYNKHIQVCHIKPQKDFLETESIGLVNELTNLIGLCPNCHWEFDHGLLKI